MLLQSPAKMMLITQNKLMINRWLDIWVMLFGVGVLGFAPLYGFSAVILLVTTLLLLILDHKKMCERFFSKEEKWFLILVLIYFVSQTLAVLYQPNGFKYQSLERQLAAFDYVSRWLLLIPVWLVFRAYKIDWVFVGVGLAIGSVIGAILGHHQVYNLGFSQAIGGSNHPIPFGELMVAADMILWLFMVKSWEMRKRFLSGFFFVASLFAFYGSLLAVTRGAWLAYGLMIAIWIAYLFFRSMRDIRNLFTPLVFLRIVFALCLFFVVSQTEHYQIMQSKTVATILGLQDGNFDGATSLRYTTFVIALESIKAYPFGIGMDNFGLAEGAMFGHAHNEFLNTAVEVGVFGFLALVALFCFGGIVFALSLNQSDGTAGLSAASGLMLFAAYLVFAQSQAVFSHHDTLLFFIFYSYLFFGQTFLKSSLKFDRNSE